MIPPGVAIQTSGTVIPVILFSRMLVIHLSLVMLMTVDTGENSIVPGVGMAVSTCIPFTLMFSREYREKLGIMHREPGWFPSRQGSMAFQTIRREFGGKMIGIASIVKIWLVAGETVG